MTLEGQSVLGRPTHIQYHLGHGDTTELYLEGERELFTLDTTELYLNMEGGTCSEQIYLTLTERSESHGLDTGLRSSRKHWIQTGEARSGACE